MINWREIPDRVVRAIDATTMRQLRSRMAEHDPEFLDDDKFHGPYCARCTVRSYRRGDGVPVLWPCERYMELSDHYRIVKRRHEGEPE